MPCGQSTSGSMQGDVLKTGAGPMDYFQITDYKGRNNCICQDHYSQNEVINIHISYIWRFWDLPAIPWAFVEEDPLSRQRVWAGTDILPQIPRLMYSCPSFTAVYACWHVCASLRACVWASECIGPNELHPWRTGLNWKLCQEREQKKIRKLRTERRRPGQCGHQYTEGLFTQAASLSFMNLILDQNLWRHWQTQSRTFGPGPASQASSQQQQTC